MEERNESTDISFKDILNYFKSGWKRILIYVLVSVIVFTAGYTLVREILGAKQYETIVKISANNSTNTNWNTTSNIEQMVKSTTIVKDALTSMEVSQERQDELIEKDIVQDITAVAHTTITNEKGEEFPETIRVAIKEDAKYGFTKDQYITFSNALANSLIKYITLQFSYKTTLTSNIAIDESLNYLQQYSQYSNLLSEAEQFLKSCEKALESFVSTETKLGIKESLLKIEGLKLQLEAVKLSIVNNEVISNSDKVSISEKEYAANRVNKLTEEVNAIQAQITEYSTLLQNYKLEITITNQASLDSNSAYSNALLTYNELQDNLINKKIELSEWQNIKNTYVSAGDNSDAINAEIKGKIVAYIANYNDLAQKINATLKDYNDNALSDKYLYVVTPAKVAKESSMSIIVMLVCEVAVALVSLIAALMVTKKKLNVK